MKSIVLFLCCFIVAGAVSAQYDVTGIYTDYNTYWNSSTTAVSTTKPDKSHNLLAFTWNGITFSTGVNDATLTTNGVTFTPKDFRALPIDAVGSASGTYIGLGQLQDGVNNGASTPPPFTAPASTTTMASYLTDGIKGLDLGTGIANIPSGQLKFTFSSTGISSAAINDGVPDVLVTQVASPSAQLDSVYFINAGGSVVGNRLSINHTLVPVTGKWMPDFYNPAGTIAFTNSERDIRLWAADLTSFGITAANASQAVALIYKLNGSSDVAFVAFNAPSLGVATKLTVGTQPSTPVNPACCGNTGTSALPQQPIVQVSDASGNNILQAGILVTASILSGPAGHGALAGTTITTTNSSGQAIFTDLVMPCEPGDYLLSFTSANLEPATSGTVTVVRPAFYVKTGNTANLSSLSSWSALIDGSGAAPDNFGAGKEFILNNSNGDNSYTTGANWTVAAKLTIPSGKTMLITSGTTTTLSCDVSESGTIQGGATSTLVLNGSSLQTLGGTNNLVNFTANNAAGVSVAGNTTVTGTLSLTSGTLSVNNASLTINGSIVRTTGNINASAVTSSVVFSGSSVQSIPASAFSGSIYNLTVNNSAGVQMGADITVSNSLQLSNGNIVLNNYNLTANSITGGSSATYVQTNGTGKLQMSIPGSGGSVLFPVGNSSYNPVTITNSNVAADQFAVRVLDEVYVNSTGGSILAKPRISRTWNIQKSGANSGAGIGFLFNWSAPQNNAVTIPSLYDYQSGWQKQTSGTTGTPTSTSMSYSGYTGSSTYFAMLDNAALLPLVWKDFTAVLRDSDVDLYWETSAEQDTREFIIERSSDALNWSSIAQVPVAGYTSAIQRYYFTDAAPLRGDNYYRVGKVHTDGHLTYSSVRFIKLSNSNARFVVLGNPVSGGSLVIRVNTREEISFLDISGKLLWRRIFSPGIHNIPSGNLSPGIYMLSSSSGSGKVIISNR